MRVAFITVGDTRRLTGGYLYHARVFAGLRARGIDLVEISASDADPASQQAHTAAFSAAFDPRLFDVVVVDALACAICSAWLDGWRALRPLVAMVHELPSVAGGSNATFEAPLLRADRLIAVSRHGQAILEARGVRPECIRIVSPGFDRLRTTAGREVRGPGSARQGDRETRGQADKGKRRAIGYRLSAIGCAHLSRVLCVAQWIERKGILDLVQAWATLKRSDAVLELIGELHADPAYTAAVRAAIAAAPWRARFVVRGAVPDTLLHQAYAQAELFALASRYEGYGMAFAEALAYGLPVVAYRVEPVPDLIGDAGVFVHAGATWALAGALGHLLDHPAERARLQSAALIRADELPTWEEAVRGFQRVLEEAVAGVR
jgi:glycosyltransferase involved in cell wall biosynthesis